MKQEDMTSTSGLTDSVYDAGLTIWQVFGKAKPHTRVLLHPDLFIVLTSKYEYVRAFAPDGNFVHLHESVFDDKIVVVEVDENSPKGSVEDILEYSQKVPVSKRVGDFISRDLDRLYAGVGAKLDIIDNAFKNMSDLLAPEKWLLEAGLPKGSLQPIRNVMEQTKAQLKEFVRENNPTRILDTH